MFAVLNTHNVRQMIRVLTECAWRPIDKQLSCPLSRTIFFFTENIHTGCYSPQWLIDELTIPDNAYYQRTQKGGSI